MNDIFPILDITCLENRYATVDEWKSDNFTNDAAVQALVKELSSGFGTWGFLYVKGHGIPQCLIDESFKVSEQFFSLKEAVKMNYVRGSGISVGYVPSQGEVFNDMKPVDLKEAFDFVPKSNLSNTLSQEMPEFVTTLSTLFKYCSTLLLKLLRLLAVALDIDSEHFTKLHSNVGNRDFNGTSLRTLYYPSVRQTVEEDQQRCSEHTDYGTITLLFQDAIGGLEVLSPSGNFIKAVPIPGTIVINAADLLHTWSKGNFLATIHRVTIPNEIKALGVARQSMAFFAHPDYEVNIEYTDENGEVKTRNAYDHVKKRFDATIALK